ncbi:MAG TPA: glucosamine-6-phosphate deaminase [Candidatus Omnitrophica bacterium]|nr:glucosamine-6-phosphate deaminase [Candidatus Omnitrophota bacterium]
MRGVYCFLIFYLSNLCVFSPSISHRRVKENLNLIICEDYKDLSRRGVEIFVSRLQGVLNEKDKAVVLIPTGGTYLNPGGFYEILIKEYKDRVDWRRVIFMNLDEYVGLSPSQPQSYNYQLTQVLQALGVPEENVFLFDGSKDPVQQCQEREELIQKLGGIDIALLGIGRNGHIAFNEPGTEKHSRTRVVELSSATKEQNSVYFGGKENIPDQAITVGIETILSTRTIILLASGESKSRAIQKMFAGESSDVPASFLLSHPDFTLIVDIAAAKEIENKP